MPFPQNLGNEDDVCSQEDGTVLGDMPEHLAAVAQKDLATAARNEKQLVKEFKYNLAYNTGKVRWPPLTLSITGMLI